MILYSERVVGEDISFGRKTESEYRLVHSCENGLQLGYCYGKFDCWKVSTSRNGFLVKNLEFDGEWLIPILNLFDINCKAYAAKHTDESFIEWFLYKFVKETMPPVVRNVKSCHDPAVGSIDIETVKKLNRAVELVLEYEENHKDEIEYVNFPDDYDFESVMMSLWLMMLSEQNKPISVKNGDTYYKIAPILGCDLKLLAFFRGVFNLRAVLSNDANYAEYDEKGRKHPPKFELCDSLGHVDMTMITAGFISKESYKSSWTKDRYGNLSFDYSSDLFNLYEWEEYQRTNKSFNVFIWDKFLAYLRDDKRKQMISWFGLDMEDIILNILTPLRREEYAESNNRSRDDAINYAKNKISKMMTPEMFGFVD